ncbi:MAG: hypothetical protein KF745_04135 [Phycisphaeraceae bacterium]|nr:hypothetical protein [Phycisphaeraceae bacterium]
MNADQDHATDPVRKEVIANLAAQPLGDGTVADLALPGEFLGRVADRVLRSSFEERFRAVVADGATPSPVSEQSGAPGIVAPMVVGRGRVSDSLAQARRDLREECPRLRNFTAPTGNTYAEGARATVADSPTPEVSRIVRQGLARDGLLATLVHAIAALKQTQAVHGNGVAVHLRHAGMPVDLLSHFAVGAAAASGSDILHYIVDRLTAGDAPGSLASNLSATPMTFRQCGEDRFEASTESGDADLEMVRLQATGTGYWGGVGAGGSLDVIRQMVSHLPDVEFLVSIEESHADAFRRVASGWALGRPDRLRIIPESLTVAQWAQDNGKAGAVEGRGGPQRAVLVPRYASRGEERSIHVPGESLLADGLRDAGLVVRHSPLLFQGGNTLVIREGATGKRVVITGEAEVYRNIGLGLSREQAAEALRIEFGADRIEVLPAASFHIDFELSVHTSGRETVVLMNDSAAATALVLSAGLGVLQRSGILNAAQARRAREDLVAERAAGFLSVVGGAVYARRDESGRWSESFANLFAAGKADSGMGNFQRFMLSMDLVAGAAARSGALDPRGLPPSDAAYLRSFERRDSDRTAIRARCEELGWRVVAVPGLSEEAKSLCPINGVRDRTRFLMPAYGGLYAPLDAAAGSVVRRALGPAVTVLPVLCGESQRRSGGVHCAASAFSGLSSGGLGRVGA